jgi:hypothetical protein
MLLLAGAAALAASGCDNVLTVPKTHLTPQYTPHTYEFRAEPAAVWQAFLAEMALENGQKAVAQDATDRVGSWVMTVKEVKELTDFACEATPVSRKHDVQGLTTGWVDVGPGGQGSSLHLTRAFMCDSIYELVIQSRGDFERGLAARMRTRLGETVADAGGANKAGHP